MTEERLSPERMADLLADELIEDLGRLKDHLARFADRWERYGRQYEALLTPGKRAELGAAFEEFDRFAGAD